MKPSRAQIEKIAERLIEHGGAFQLMLADEREAGHTPVFPGEVPWFSADDWPHDVVVSLSGNQVRIIAIQALKEGGGAFSRLISGIARAGLIPIVVEPMFAMPEILERWGWSKEFIGSGFETRQEIWKPSAEWLRERGRLI